MRTSWRTRSATSRIGAHCGLEVTPEMVAAAKANVQPDRTRKWERLDPRDLARVVPELRDEMRRHGYEVPGELAPAVAGLVPDRRDR